MSGVIKLSGNFNTADLVYDEKTLITNGSMSFGGLFTEADESVNVVGPLEDDEYHQIAIPMTLFVHVKSLADAKEYVARLDENGYTPETDDETAGLVRYPVLYAGWDKERATHETTETLDEFHRLDR